MKQTRFYFNHFMRSSFAKVRVISCCVAGMLLLGVGSVHAQLLWTNFIGSTPYSANTTSSGFSLATISSSASLGTSPSDPNNPSGNYLFQFHSNGLLTFTLTPTGNTTMTSLSFDYDDFSANTINWSYSVAGGSSGGLSTVSLSSGSWESATVNLSSIHSTGGAITLSGNVNTGGVRLGNFDVTGVVAAVPEPSTYGLMVVGIGFVAACSIRACRRQQNAARASR